MSKAKILTKQIAERFLKDEDSVDLQRFTSIEDAAAQALAQHRGGDLDLDGLTSLSDAAAQALAQYEGTLSLNGLKKLSDAAAQALARHKGDYINLEGLTSLSDSPGHVALARKLAQRKGRLYLWGLTSLSDVAAKALTEHDGHIHFSDLQEISDQGLLALAGKSPQLHWSASLTKRLKTLLLPAEPPSESVAPPEWVNGAIVLRPPGPNSEWRTQSRLSKHSDVPTSLLKWFITLLPKEHIRDVDYGYYVVHEVSDAAAGLLVDNRRFFEGVRKAQAAYTKAIFTEHPDLLKLRKLVAANDMGGFLMAIDMMKTLGFDEDAWIATLSKSRLKVICDPRNRLSGQGHAVHALLEAAADRPKLVTHLFSSYGGTGIAVPDEVKELSQDAAVVLAKYRGNLRLESLTVLSDAAAQALAQHKGELYLDGLTSLSDAAAQALAQHKGSLYLSGLTSLSDAAAQALAQHKGRLFLDGLTSLSDAAAQALAQHKGELYLWGLTSLSDAAAQALAQSKGDLSLEGKAMGTVTRARKRLAAAKKKAATKKPKAKSSDQSKSHAATGSASRLEFEGGGSSKFWESELRGAELVVRFGRLGTDGQEKIKAFPDAAAAAKEQAKLIKEKLRKGYQEV